MRLLMSEMSSFFVFLVGACRLLPIQNTMWVEGAAGTFGTLDCLSRNLAN